MVQERLIIVDTLRGVTIILMIFFHFSYDLNFFKFVTIDFTNHFFWYWLPRLIAALFLFCVGISLKLAHEKQFQWQKFNYRFLKIFVGAILVSLSTYFIMPDRWIYFGTLHCIALSSLIALPFVRFPKSAMILGTLIFIAWYPLEWIAAWPKLPQPSLDNLPLIPWIFFVFLGVYLSDFLKKIKISNFPYQFFLQTLSKHSLLIYLLHQPILLGILFIIWKYQ